MRAIQAVTVLASCVLLGTCSPPPMTARYYGEYPTPLPPQQSEEGMAKPGSPSAKRPSPKTKVSSAQASAPRKTPVKANAKVPVTVTKTVTIEPQVSTTEADPAPEEAPARPSLTTVESGFEAAREKANRDGVQSLTQEDIEGLSFDQIKELRGY